MSKIYKDTDVEYVKITLKTRASGGSNLTVYAGVDYYDEDALYSGSPEIFPLLSSSPRVIRSVGDHIGIRHDINIDIDVRQPFTRFNKGFIDLRETYEFYRASVEVYYGIKPFDSVTSSSAFELKQDVEVLTSSWGSDTLTLSCRDIWFEEKELSRRIPDSTVITEFDTELREEYVGEYAPMPFGADQVVDVFVFDVNGLNAIYLLAGFNHNDTHCVKDLKEWYVENPTLDLSNDRYLRMDEATSILYGSDYPFTGLPSSTPFHLGQFWRSTPFTPAKGSFLTTFQVTMTKTGSPTDENGEIEVALYRASTEYTTEGSFPPTGNKLTSVKIPVDDVSNSTPGRTINFDFPYPLVEGIKYCILTTYSNRDDTTDYVNMSVLGFSSPDHDSLDRSTEDAGWSFQSGVRSSIVPAAIVPGAEDLRDENGFYYNRVTISHSIGLGAGSAIPNAEAYTMKYKVDGLKDNPAGTYTGTGDALIEVPADLLRFIMVELMDITASDLDTSSFTSVRSSQSTESYKLGFVIDRETFAQDLIIEICKQSRTVLYKEAGGKYKVHFWEPSPVAASVANQFANYELQDEMKVISIEDEPINRVFNFFDQDYINNALNYPTDPQITRRSRTDKFLERQFLNENDSTAADTSRETNMAHSVSLYGTRRMEWPYDLHTDATAVQNLQNYYADRFYLRHQIVTVEIPRRLYYQSVELLESGLVDSDEIGDDEGYMTAEGARDAGSTTLSAAVSSYPTATFNFGRLQGIITGIEESGPFMRVTILTDDGAGSY